MKSVERKEQFENHRAGNILWNVRTDKTLLTDKILETLLQSLQASSKSQIAVGLCLPYIRLYCSKNK